ncbi:Type IIS restriction enzyme Eco57I [Mycobacterium marinum]|uniref:hypothetical protein n=2 Tax=Mycobacterium marinum TaxID=1781 RepID=UPI000E3C5DEB|nr:hypothetical protein [Mycobacterium marinum]RFZ15665.1 Type IIS restriction enzyme Eco57I [Mycobacterium marinum]RFZ47117.1 Type IIS restriction enzyme Eco57I [Mycobacterium marinum]RFZ49632.1 Type IIS restriction enzyme Eco57I [Mycobacterium marinum]
MAAVFAKMETAGVAKLSEWVRIFVGVQTSADKTYFIHLYESRSTPDLAHFTDPDGKHWDIERSILRPGIQDKGTEPYGFRPEPDAQVIFPYEIEEVDNKTGGRRKVACRFSLKEMEATYPKALDYFRDKEAKLKPPARSVEPPPGEAFWSYGRSQSLTRLDAPKIIARVLSLTPRYAIDPDGLVACGGGDGGPYYLLRLNDECRYSMEVLIALLSHPAVDAYVASRGKAYRGSYISHRKAFLEPVPVPDLSDHDQAEIAGMVHELFRRIGTSSE